MILRSAHFRWWLGFGLLSALLLTGETRLLLNRIAAMHAAEKQRARNRHLLEELAALTPAPSVESTEQLKAEIEIGQRRLAMLSLQLDSRGFAAERLKLETSPTTRTESFFDLVTFVETTRERFRKQGITLAPAAEYLGFSIYAQEAPDAAAVAAVFRQRLIAQQLMDALLEARPHSVLAVQRERLLEETDQGTRLGGFARGAGSSSDTFVSDARFALASVGKTPDRAVFRLVFTGDTDALRTLINRLANSDWPLVVRAVEIQALPAEKNSAAASKEREGLASSIVLQAQAPAVVENAGEAFRIVVPKSYSQFTVVVEFAGDRLEFAKGKREGGTS